MCSWRSIYHGLGWVPETAVVQACPEAAVVQACPEAALQLEYLFSSLSTQPVLRRLLFLHVVFPKASEAAHLVAVLTRTQNLRKREVVAS